MNLTKKKVFVSGAAGRLGIGLVSDLLAEGVEVFAGVRTEAGAKTLMERLNGSLDADHIIQLDVSIASQVNLAELEIRNSCGLLDGLVNLAAISTPANTCDVTSEGFMRTFEVNCLGSLLQIRMAESLMNTGGSIVLLSSIYAVVAPRFEIYDGISKPNSVDYGMSKAAVEQLTRYEAIRLASRKIRVNAIRLGPALGVYDETDPALISSITEQIPSGRWASSAELSSAVKFLLGEDSEFMTGSVLTLDGGWTAQ